MLPANPKPCCTSAAAGRSSRPLAPQLFPTISRHFHVSSSSGVHHHHQHHSQQPQQQQQHCQQQQQWCSSSSRGTLVTAAAAAAAAAGKGFGNPSKLKTAGSKASSKGKRRCPCGSGQAYEACCQRYHSGSAAAPTPEALLRARFSAYALQEVDYLVKTTHRQNPEHTGSSKTYARALRSTAAAVEYLQLDVGGPVGLQELPQSYVSSMAGSAGAGSAGAGQQAAAAAGEAAAAAAAGEAAAADAFLRFSVRFRPRDGGPEQTVNEVSHFRQEDGQWLYYNEVDL